MKKSIEKLFKNGIFRKVTMGMLFVLVCCFSFFANWKATAEGENCTLGWNESAYWQGVTGSVTGVQYQMSNENYANLANDAWQSVEDISTGSQSLVLDSSKHFYVKVTFSEGNTLNASDVCLFYKNSDCAKNSKAIAQGCEYYEGTRALKGCYFVLTSAVFPTGTTSYELHILPKSYSFHTGNFRLSGGGTKNAYDFLDIRYKLGGEEGDLKSFPSYQVTNPPQESMAGTYYGTLLFDLPQNIKLGITGKNELDISNLKYSDNKDVSVGGTLWSSDDNPFTHEGYSVTGSVNIYFDEIKASLSLESLDENVSLADKVALSYNFDGGSTYTDFAVTPNTNNYAPISDITLGQKIYIKATSKTGYNINNLEYKFNNGSETTWPEGGVNFVINRDSTLKIGGIEEKKVTINPNYHNGTSFDPAYLYNALELKYKLDGDTDFQDWTVNTNGTQYTNLEVQEGKTVYVQATIKNGYGAATSNKISYKFYDEETAYNNASLVEMSLDNNVGTASLRVANNKNLTFSGIKEINVTLNPNYHNGTSFDPEHLYKALKLQYKKASLGGIFSGNYEDWPTNAGRTQYANLEVQKNRKVRVKVTANPGYDISSLGYKSYTGDTLPSGDADSWPEGGVKDFTISDSSNLVFTGIKFKKIRVKFIATDLGEGVEQSEILNVYRSSQTPSDSHEIDAHQKYRFRMVFSNCNSSMKGSFDIGNNIKAYHGNEDVTAGFTFENAGWEADPDPNPNNLITFSFDVTSNTDLSEADFKIDGIVLKNMNIKFEQGDDQLINVGKADDGSGYENYDWEPDGTFTVSSSTYGGNFEFVLKPRSGGKWGKNLPDSLPEWSDLIVIRGAEVSTSLDSVTYNEQIYYKIKIEGIKSDFSIKLKSGIVEFHTINVSFAGINLPNDGHNGIDVSQEGADVRYPDRGNDIYVLKAEIFPNSPEKPITITLPSTENFKFANQDEDRDFIFFQGTNQEAYAKGEISDEGKIISFSIPNEGNNNILKYLESGNIDVKCYCLVPEKKKISFALNGGVTATVSDQRGNILPVEVGSSGTSSSNIVSDDSHFVMAAYGDLINITYKLKSGHFLDNPEEQITIYEVVKNSDDSEKLVPLSYDTHWNIQDVNGSKTIVFDSIIQSEIKAVFNCDKDNIPIEFKNIGGLTYYSVNLEDDKDEINESNPFVIKDAQTNEKETLKGIVTTPIDSNFYFAVGVDAGYDIDSLKVTQNGNEPENNQQQDETGGNSSAYKFIECKFTKADMPEGYKFYKLIKVSSNVTISGAVSKKTLTVNFESNTKVDGTNETAKVEYKRDGVNIGTSLGVTYGNAAVFTVSLPEEKYSQSDFKVWVRGKLQPENTAVEVVKYQNEYRILDVDEDKIVYVTDVKVNRYVLNFVANDKSEYLFDDRSFSGTKYADHGSSLEFKVRAKEGYKLDGTVVNYQGKIDRGLAPTYTSGSGENVIYTFKISNIQENSTITVNNVSDITYKVLFQDVPGATYLNDKNSVISGKVTVGYGKNFEFGVNIDDDYDDSAAGMFIVLNDGKTKLNAQKLSSGRYMIPNITEDVKIRVGNIRKNTYTVTLRNEEGIDYYNSSDKIITGDNTVEHGGSLSFRVLLYPAYSDSDITVMLGNDKMTPDSSGYYHISGVVENKIVTVTGIHANSEVDLINAINNLPQSVNDLNDVNSIIEASKWYNSLTDAQKANVSNADVLKNLQQQAGAVLHRGNGVTIEGPEWYVKLVVVPISSDMDACARIYKKLNSEYILSLYDIYLWDTLNDVRYIPGVDEMYTVTIPTPKLTNFRNPTGVHEDSNTGKVSFMDLVFNGDTVSFQTNSFSPMGVVASHDATGVSSLFDASGARLDWINDYVLGSASRGPADRGSSDGTLFDNRDDDATQNDDENIGNINDKFRGINNRVTPQGSALRLILVLLILILIALAIWIIYKKRKENGKDD